MVPTGHPPVLGRIRAMNAENLQFAGELQFGRKLVVSGRWREEFLFSVFPPRLFLFSHRSEVLLPFDLNI